MIRFVYLFFLCLGIPLLGNDLNRAPRITIPKVERIHLDHEPGVIALDRDVYFGPNNQRTKMSISIDLTVDPRVKAAHIASNVYYRGRVIAKKDIEVTWD